MQEHTRSAHPVRAGCLILREGVVEKHYYVVPCIPAVVVCVFSDSSNLRVGTYAFRVGFNLLTRLRNHLAFICFLFASCIAFFYVLV